MIDLAEKSKELIEALNKLENVNASSKKKYLKCLQTIVSGKNTFGDPVFQMLRNSECYIEASSFIKSNGKPTFEQLWITTPKNKYIELFKKFEKTFTDEEYWENLIQTYTMQDYQQNDYQIYKKLFSSKRKSKEKMMSLEEQDYLNNLPETISIYRGGSLSEKENGFGISWTLNKDIAAKFVNIKKALTDSEMVIHEIEIPKLHVVAYVNSRKEEEIIYLGQPI